MKPINGFFNKSRFLSNFWFLQNPIEYNGLKFYHVEGAYQCSKSNNIDTQIRFLNLSPKETKCLGRTIKKREDFEKEKITIMTNLVMQKFQNNPCLKYLLLKTGNIHLEEGNNWGDTFWGTVNGRGQNNLGKILMLVRKRLK